MRWVLVSILLLTSITAMASKSGLTLSGSFGGAMAQIKTHTKKQVPAGNFQANLGYRFDNPIELSLSFYGLFSTVNGSEHSYDGTVIGHKTRYRSGVIGPTVGYHWPFSLNKNLYFGSSFLYGLQDFKFKDIQSDNQAGLVANEKLTYLSYGGALFVSLEWKVKENYYPVFFQLSGVYLKPRKVYRINEFEGPVVNIGRRDPPTSFNETSVRFTIGLRLF